MKAPVWLLDIDGVINAVTDAPDGRVWPRDQWIRATATCAGIGWPLLAARPVLDFIRRVHLHGRAEIRWHTTWQHDAYDVAAALDLPRFPIQPCPEADALQRVGGAAPSGPRWWKLPAAVRVVRQEGRALLWTDDDAGFQLPDPAPRLFGGTTALVVSPRTHQGLTIRHLHRIGAFLDDVRRRTGRSARRVPARAGR